jgi:hypothetical protein
LQRAVWGWACTACSSLSHGGCCCCCLVLGGNLNSMEGERLIYIYRSIVGLALNLRRKRPRTEHWFGEEQDKESFNCGRLINETWANEVWRGVMEARPSEGLICRLWQGSQSNYWVNFQTTVNRSLGWSRVPSTAVAWPK